MRLSELVSNMGLWVFPAVGLIFFLIAFGIVCVRVARTPREEADHNGLIPLHDGSEPAPSTIATRSSTTRKGDAR